MTKHKTVSRQTMYRLYYYHDPMCSWCWAYRPVSDQLFAKLPENVELKYILGGLAPDCDQLMPTTMKLTIKGYWKHIQERLGTEFNFDFWTQCQPRRSTYPACRGVIAAGKQNAYVAMIDAIQRGYYLRAMNPSDNTTLITLAGELHLDIDRFIKDLSSEATEKRLQSDISFTRSSPIQGFPSLVLDLDGKYTAISPDYKSYQSSLKEIDNQLANHIP